MSTPAQSIQPLRVQSSLPVRRDPPLRSRHWLVDRMLSRRGKRGTSNELFAAVVIKPILARLKAGDNRMARLVRVVCGVLRGGIIAAPDVAASGAATQMQPPALGVFALNAAGTAGRHRGIDGLICHVALLSTPELQWTGCNLCVGHSVSRRPRRRARK
jgi:hypothetical protein